MPKERKLMGGGYYSAQWKLVGHWRLQGRLFQRQFKDSWGGGSQLALTKKEKWRKYPYVVVLRGANLRLK